MFSKTKRFNKSQLNQEFGGQNKRKASQPSKRISKSPSRDPPSPHSQSDLQRQPFFFSFQSRHKQQMNIFQANIINLNRNYFGNTSKSATKGGRLSNYSNRYSRSPTPSPCCKRINEEDFLAKFSENKAISNREQPKKRVSLSIVEQGYPQHPQNLFFQGEAKQERNSLFANRSKNSTSKDNPLNISKNTYNNKENMLSQQLEEAKVESIIASEKKEQGLKRSQTLKKFKEMRNEYKQQRFSLGKSQDQDTSKHSPIRQSFGNQDTSMQQNKFEKEIQFNDGKVTTPCKSKIQIDETKHEKLKESPKQMIDEKINQQEDKIEITSNNIKEETSTQNGNEVTLSSPKIFDENKQQRLQEAPTIIDEKIPQFENDNRIQQSSKGEEIQNNNGKETAPCGTNKINIIMLQKLTEQLKTKDDKIQELEEDIKKINSFYQSKSRLQQDYLNNFLQKNLQLKYECEQLKEENERQKENIEELKRQIKQRESEKIVEQQHDQIIQFRGNLRIFCRIKPVVEKEEATNMTNENSLMIQVNQRHRQVVEIKNDDNGKYFFDYVFDTNSEQEDIFSQTQPFIQCALNGDQVSIIAYGQTGSGKTYTMEGNYDKNNISINQQSGILPRTASYLFKEKDRVHIHRNLVFTVGVIEVYCEELRDLLQIDEKIQQKLEIIQQNKRIKVLNQTFQAVKSAEELLSVIKRSSQNRVTDKTTQNSRSSRSHCIYSIKIHENDIEKGSINIVDLAGSESFQATANKRESSFINKSLTTLKRIITMLSDRQSLQQSKIPYRESKLTRLLQDSLGGDSKTLIFVTVCPLDENFIQTKESLKFISKATL